MQVVSSATFEKFVIFVFKKTGCYIEGVRSVFYENELLSHSLYYQ